MPFFSRIYRIILGLLAIASLAALMWDASMAPRWPWWLLLIVGFANALSLVPVTRVPVDAKRGVYIGISDAPFVFTAMVFGPAAIVPIILFDIVIHRWRRKTSKWIDTFFNETHACMIYLILVGWARFALSHEGIMQAASILVLAVLYPVWDAVTLALILSSTTRRDVRMLLRERLVPTAWLLSISASFGALAGVYAQVNPWLAVVMVFPLVLTYYAIRAVARWLDASLKAQAYAEQLAKTNTELETLNRELEQRVAERTAEVEALLELRTRTSIELVHDLNHRFDVIQNSVVWLRQNWQGEHQSASPLDQAWQAIDQAVSAGTAYLGEILDTARIDQHSLVLQAVPFDLGAVVRRVAQQFELECLFHECTLAISISDDIPQASADPVRIERVVFNLIDNAVRYAVDFAETQSRSMACVDISVRNDEEGLAVVVRDTGPGMTIEQIQRLGGWSERIERTGVRGTGLGLAFCARILALSGGRLVVESAGAGQGSTFTAIVPSVQCMAANIARLAVAGRNV